MESKRSEFFDLVIVFFVFSFIGFCYEIILYSPPKKGWHFVNNCYNSYRLIVLPKLRKKLNYNFVSAYALQTLRLKT